MGRHGKKNRGLVKRGKDVSWKTEIVFVAFVKKKGDQLVAVGAMDGAGAVDLSGVTTIRSDEAQDGEFIVGVVPRNKLKPAHVAASAVQVVPWTAFKESESKKSIFDHIVSKPTGELTPKYKSFLGTKSKAVDVIIRDGNTYLKGFLSTGGCVSYSHVKTFTKDFSNANKGVEIRYGDGNAFTLLVRKPYDAKGVHPALICEGWATLRVPVAKLIKTLGVNWPTLQKATKESGAGHVYWGDWIEIENVDRLNKALLDHPEWVVEVEESRKKKKARVEELEQQHKMEEDKKLKDHQQLANAARVRGLETPSKVQLIAGEGSTAQDSETVDDNESVQNGKGASGGGSQGDDLIAAPLTEIEFLEKLKDYIGRCGFVFSDRDIVRFHTCVKCGWLTLLGGDPGCGKSSLAELYARALLGRRYEGTDSPEDRSVFLRVNVNPSWVEPADVFGYSTGKKSKDFHPALCGLREFLVMKTAGVMRLACLEEINLARVEHYFADMIQAMSSNEGNHLSLPDPMPSGTNGRMDVGAEVRLIGTFNEDETVQPMSSRFLDRCAVIRLMLSPSSKCFSKPRGRMQSLKDEPLPVDNYEKWCGWEGSNNEINEKIDKLLFMHPDGDEAKPTIMDGLKEVGALPSPRVCGAVEKYVALRPNFEKYSADDLLKIALDEAFAQRIFSKCRALPQSEAYGRLIAAVESILRVEVDDQGRTVSSVSCDVLNRIKKESEDMMKWGA